MCPVSLDFGDRNDYNIGAKTGLERIKMGGEELSVREKQNEASV